MNVETLALCLTFALAVFGATWKLSSMIAGLSSYVAVQGENIKQLSHKLDEHHNDLRDLSERVAVVETTEPPHRHSHNGSGKGGNW